MKSLVSDDEHQRNLQRVEDIRRKREMAARQRAEEEEALAERKK